MGGVNVLTEAGRIGEDQLELARPIVNVRSECERPVKKESSAS